MKSFSPRCKVHPSLVFLVAAAAFFAGCSSDSSSDDNTGGTANSTGGVANSTGGRTAGTTIAPQAGHPTTGGSSTINGGGASSSGGTNAASTTGATVTGGASSAGGASTTGTKAMGGVSTTGGASSTGGTSSAGGASNTGGTSSVGGTSTAGGATAAGGTSSVGGSSGLLNCTTQIKGSTCDPVTAPACTKVCGVENKGIKTLSCTTVGSASTWAESDCSYPTTGNYACYTIPTALPAACSTTTVPKHGQPCTVASCTVCWGTDSGLSPTSPAYEPSGSTTRKNGYCVCSATAGTWACASTTAWPCPAGASCGP